MITSKDCPAFGGVYKLAAVLDEKTGAFIPKIKLSENTEKITNPGNKKILRIYDKETRQDPCRSDLPHRRGIRSGTGYDHLRPAGDMEKTKIKGGTYTLREMLVPVFLKGECVYTSPSVMEIRDICMKEKDTLWDETKRLANPHTVYVDLSDRLYQIKSELLEQMGREALSL